MPQAIATFAVNALVAAGVSATSIGVLAISYTLVYYTVSAVLINGVMKALSPKPPKYEPAPRTQTIADTRSSGRVLFGTVNVGGAHVLPPIVTAGVNTAGTTIAGVWTHRIQALAMHEVDSFGPVYAEQALIPDHTIEAVAGTLSDGRVGYTNPSGTPYDSGTASDGVAERRLMIRRYTGTSTQTVDYILNYVDSAAFSSNFRLRGIAYAALTGAYDAAYTNGFPPFSFVVHGMKVYDPRKDSTNGGSGTHRYATPSTWEWSNNPILCAAALCMLDKELGGGSADPATDINWTTVATAASVCDTLVPGAGPFTAFANSANASISGNTITKTGGGSGWNESVRSTNGITKGSVCCGCYDTVNDAMFGISTSPAANDSYTGIDYGIIFRGSAHSSDIQIWESGVQKLVISTAPTLKSWGRIDYTGTHVIYWVNGKIVRCIKVPTASATYYFDTSLFDVGAGLYLNYQPRYTCNLQLECTTLFEENLSQIIQCCLGKCFDQGGVYQFFAGAWDSATFTINHNDWIGPLSIQAVAPRREGRWNGVQGWYYDPMRNWQRTQAYARTNDTYKTQDGGERIWVEVDQPGTNDESEAQRKDEFLLRQSRNGIKITGKLPARFQSLSMFETGVVNLADAGWSSKTFRVVNYTFNDREQTVTVVLSEEQSADWTDLTTAEYNVPSTTPLPAANETVPTEPQSLTAQADYGLLRFQWSPPVVAPVGMRYRLLRSENTLASPTTVVWEGSSTRMDLKVDPRSGYWYFTQAVAATGSYTSPYSPNTYGVFGKPWPDGSEYASTGEFVDGTLTLGGGSYWLGIADEITIFAANYQEVNTFVDNAGINGAKAFRFMSNSKASGSTQLTNQQFVPVTNYRKPSGASTVSWLNPLGIIPAAYGQQITVTAAIRVNSAVTMGIALAGQSLRSDVGSGFTIGGFTFGTDVYSAAYYPTVPNSIQFFVSTFTVTDSLACGIHMPFWSKLFDRNQQIDVLRYQVNVS